MRDTDLYTRILGIAEPWTVSLVELDAPRKTVTVYVSLDSANRLQCPQCGRSCGRYDHRQRQWRHLDTMQFKTILQADIPRVECPEHGVSQITVPWAEQRSRFTALFEALVIDWLKVAPTTTVAEYLDMSWNAVDGIMQRAVERGRARRAQPSPEHLSVDETSYQKGHQYVTVVSDQHSGHVLYVADGRSKESLDGFFQELSTEQIAAIESISMDMHPGYISVINERVPLAEQKICFDKFHVAQYLSKSVDTVRRQEHRALMAVNDDRLKSTRHSWLRNPDKMTARQFKEFKHLRESNLKTARAWAIKEMAMCLWHYTSRTWAEKQWNRLISWGLRCRLEPVRKAIKTIQRHLYGILNAVIAKRTNAMAESINSRIQKIKKRACGFRNRPRFRAAIMFHLGGLDLYPRPHLP